MVDTARYLRHVPDDPDCDASLPSSPTLNETSLTIVAASSSMAGPALLVPWGILGSGLYTRSLAFATRTMVVGCPPPWLLLHACSPAMR